MGNRNDRPVVALQEHYDILEQDVPLAERNCDLLETSTNHSSSNATCLPLTVDGFRAFMSTDETEHHNTATMLCTVNLAIWDYVAPWYLLIGVAGNALAMAVWMQPQLRRHTSGMSATLVMLAGCDIVVLCSGFLRHYVRKTSYIGHDIQTSGSLLCKVTEFVVYYSLCYSSWLVSTIAVERCMAIVYYDSKSCCPCWGRRPRARALGNAHAPRTSVQAVGKKRFSGCCDSCLRTTSNSVRLSLVILAIACLLLYGHIFWTRVYSETEQKCRNTLDTELQHFMQHVWPYLDMIFAVLLPHTVTIVASCVIIAHLRCVHGKFAGETVAATSNASSPHASGRTLVNRSFVARHSLRIAFTLVCICTFYVLCQTPAKLWLVLRPISARRPEHAHVHFYNRITWTTLVMVQYAAHISNFFIYSLSNEKFRKGLLTLLHRKKHRVPRLKIVRTNTFISPDHSQRGNQLELISTQQRRGSAPALLAPSLVSEQSVDQRNNQSSSAGQYLII